MKKIIFISSLLIFSYFDLDAFQVRPNEPHDPKRNRFPVIINNKWGFIDKTGKIVIRPKYDYVEHFHENIALVANNKGFGFIDLSGNEIIPCKYQKPYYCIILFTEMYNGWA